MNRFAFPWVLNRNFDLLFVFFPAFLVLAVLIVFPGLRTESYKVSTLSWVVLVLGIDVAHVYSTIYRTYFHSHNFHKHKNLLLVTPILVWLIGVMIYSFGGHLFWTLLAYLAVFHFIRQQYGFMRIYSRGEASSPNSELIDTILIHLLPLYPVIYWHTKLPRNFSWMMEGDFISGLHPFWEKALFVFYLLTIGVYIGKEAYSFSKGRPFNFPKNLLILSTGLTWYVGIVLLNGDMAFTLTNVVAHGIPYMALVWSEEKKEEKRFTTWVGVLLFVGLLLGFAYLEEALWAGFVWREHLEIFGLFSHLPEVIDTATLALIVPLLTVPQVTHYILDGFIWKKRL